MRLVSRSAALILGLGWCSAVAAEDVRVSGGSAPFPAAIRHTFSGSPVNLRITGAGMRKKLFVNVYSIGSYLQEGVTAKSAEQLVAADSAKVLHLVIERDIGGTEMSEAFRSSIALNYPPGAFSAELTKFDQALRACSVRKGDHIWLYSSSEGFRCIIDGKMDLTIPNPAFARAIWEIYLGRKNLGDDLKRSLVSRL